MNDTAVAVTDFDRLAERVERAATLVVELRGKNAQLEQERMQLQQERALLQQDRAQIQQRLEETQSRLQGQDPMTLVNELSALKKEQREWLGERRDVATRIEALLGKLDRLE